MKAEQIVIPSVIAVVVGAFYYLLKGTGQPLQVSYPNADASGLPPHQSAGVSYNFGASQPAPSPALIYMPPPPLPPTPNYQKYNYSPMNIFALTPEAAQLAQGTTQVEGSCCCPEGNTPMFDDGNLMIGVVANKSEQVRSGDPKLYDNLRSNLASSVASDDNFVWAHLAEQVAAAPTAF